MARYLCHPIRLAIAASLIVLTACGGSSPDGTVPVVGGGSPPSPTPSPTPIPTPTPIGAADGKVAILAGVLTRDGAPWVPHGVVQIAFVAPPAKQTGVFKAAYNNYDPADYVRMRTFGIDTVRMQVSQPGLDPMDPAYDAAFRNRMYGAVAAARQAGLSVIVSVQDETQSGETTPTDLPNEATRRVWAEIAPHFAGDTGIALELLNEPRLAGTTENWRSWATQMDLTIQTVRNAGAPNVVIADGLQFAERLDPAATPDLTDSLGQVAYASHPYAHSNVDTAADWNMKFGNFAASHPVIVTEWATPYNPETTYYCGVDTPASSQAFLDYLKGHRIGLMAFAWDFAGTKFASTFDGFPPKATSFSGKRCGDDDFGPGEQVIKWYYS